MKKKQKFVDIKGNYFDLYKSKSPIMQKIVNNWFHNTYLGVKKTGCKQILDAGCGEGHVTNYLYKKHLKIQGMDFDRKVFEYPKIKFTEGSMYKIPFKDNSFDVVTSTFVLEHLERPEKAVMECRRVAKKYCVFAVPNEPIWRVANIARLTYLKDFGNTPGHINHFGKRQFKKMLKKHFREVTVKRGILTLYAVCKK